MSDESKETKETHHREIHALVVKAVTSKEFPASEVGEVLVSIGAAMLKGSNMSETEFIAYARKAWALQKPKASPARN